MPYPREITWSLPEWAEDFERAVAGRSFDTANARVGLAIELSSTNVARATGGPFGAAVFERDSGRLVSVGVNVVVQTGCSHAHAEMLALALAQRAVGGYDLGAPCLPAHVLATSSEPCAMCFGSLPWSGVRRLECGAAAEDAEAVGFDEGPIPPDWDVALRERGIEVVRRVRRDEARDVLQRYRDSGGEIYNARKG